MLKISHACHHDVTLLMSSTSCRRTSAISGTHLTSLMCYHVLCWQVFLSWLLSHIGGHAYCVGSGHALVWFCAGTRKEICLQLIEISG